MPKRIQILFVAVLCAVTAAAATKAVFLTGGQSNTDGRLYANTLPSYLQTANNFCLASNHWPYSSDRLGVFYPYYPTSGTTGQYSRWAYDAVTYYYIGQALQETFYVAKTSCGGTSIDPGVSNSPSGHDNAWLSQYGAGYHWSADPTFLTATTIAGTTFVKDDVTYDGQSLLLAWIANIDAAIDAIKANGDTPDIKAIIWHQGESDKNAAGSYYNNLKAMVAYVRNHIVEKTGESKYSTLPFFCGTIPHASSLCNSTVEKAFYRLQDEDENFHVIDLRDLTMLSDTKHFDAPSAELFGKRLYNRMIDEGVISGTRLDDVEYAQVDYSDFGTDEFVGETFTWNFNNQSGSFYSGSQIVNSMYLHGGGSTQRRFEYYTGQTAQTLIYPDSYVQSSTSYVRCNLGSNIDENAVSADWNASHGGGNCIALNVLYPGTFTIKVALETADKHLSLIFNGKIVATETATSETVNTIREVTYTASSAGTYYIWTNSPYKLWGARYVPTTDRTWQRVVTTDADGYATFGNITGANLGLPAGLTAWAVAPSGESDEKVEMTQLLGVDKNTGAILQGAPSTTYTLPFAWTAQNYEGENGMTAQQTTGDVEETSGEDFINYTFANKQFTKVSTPISVEAGKAYLSISNGAAQCSYSTLMLDMPDESGFEPTKVTVGESGYAVFSNLTDANLALPEGLTAYALLPGDIDDDVAKMVPATVIGAGQAVLIEGTSGSYTLKVDASAVSDVASGNLLVAVEGWQKPLDTNSSTGNKQYLLNGSEFVLGNGKTYVYKGEAMLSVPAANLMAAYNIVKLTPSAVTYDFVDAYTLFGNDEVVTRETTWITGNMTTPGSSGTVEQLNGLYGRGQNGSNNRSFFKNNASGSATFSDGTKVSWSSYLYINADYSGGWSLSASTHANNTTCGDYLAFNAAVPGTVYVLFSSKDASGSRTLDLYYEGTKAASATSTGSSDIKEIKYNVSAAGTLLLDCRKTCRVYALRFVPKETGVYTRVTPTEWAILSFPYPAVVPEGVSVYYANAYQDGNDTGAVTLVKVEKGGIIPAKTGFIINGTKGLYCLEKATTAATWNDNLLVGTAGAALTGYNSGSAANPIFTLGTLDGNTKGFKKFTGTDIEQYQGYLQFSTVPTASSFRLVFGGETAIEFVRSASRNDVRIIGIYSLNGQRLNAPQRGINIVKQADGATRVIVKK